MDINSRGIARYKDKFVLVTGIELIILDNNFNVVKQIKLEGMYDYHGVAVYGDHAYVVETNNNCIGIYDLEKSLRIDQIKFTHENFDVNHINDLFIHKDNVYISMFSYTKQWRETSQDSGVILEYSLMDRKHKTLHQQNLTHPHSIIYRNDKLFYCNSGKLEVKRDEVVIFTGLGYTRGLACYEDDFLFIGQSESRNIDITAKDRTNISLNCGIYAFDVGKRSSKFFNLPATEIYGMLLI